MKKSGPSIWLGLALLAAGLRLTLIPTRLLLEDDGPYYVALAAQLLRGDLSGALNDYWSQFYPVMIAFVGVFVRDPELAARSVSALCGAALVPSVWWLTNELADPLSANLAGLLTLFQPWLLVFSALALTEMTFTLLTVAALALMLRAARLGGPARFALAGGMTGLAILTRPEGLLLVAGLLAAGLTRAIRQRTWQALRENVVAFGVLLIVLAPQSVGTYRIYGHFNSGWKSSVGIVVGEASNDPSEAERAIYTLDKHDSWQLNTQARQTSIGRYWLEHPAQALWRVGKNAAAVWQEDMLQVWMPVPSDSAVLMPAIGLLACLGFTTGLASAKRGPLFGILIFVAAYALGLLSVLVHPRLLLPLAPFALIFVAMGCSGAARAGQWVAARWVPADWQRVGAWAILLTGGMALSWMALASYAWAGERRDPFSAEPLAEKQAGLWLRANAPQTAKLLSHNPQTPFYFYKDWPFDRALAIPWASPQAVLAYAHHRDADYIVLEEWVIGAAHFPVEIWLDTTLPHPGLRLLEVFGTAPYRVILYQLTGEVTMSGAAVR